MKWYVLAVVLVGCRVAPLDYEGKDCPCPAGYTCDLASQTCTTELVPDDARSDSRLVDGNPTASCFTNPRNSLVYSTVGFPDFVMGWLSGNGSWTKVGNEVQQTNSANDLAWLSHALPTTNGAESYRLVATMRVIDSLLGNGSAGIGFRVAFTGNMYSCAFDPATGELQLILTQNLADATLQKRSVMTGADPTAAFTMEISATGGVLACCLRGYSSSLLTTQDATIATGNVGIVARKAEAGFTSFFVYE